MSEGVRLAILLGVVAVLVPFVGWVVFRSARQIAGGRALFQELARVHGLRWTPPKNAQDHLGPGRAKGRYRDHTLTVDTDWHQGGTSGRGRSLPNAVVRVRSSQSLGMGLHGGTGSFRAQKGELVELEGPLARRFRVAAQDAAAARALLSDADVVERLAALDGASKGVRIDDGVLECTVAFPASAGAFLPAIDRVIDAVESIDAWRSAAEERRARVGS